MPAGDQALVLQPLMVFSCFVFLTMIHMGFCFRGMPRIGSLSTFARVIRPISKCKSSTGTFATETPAPMRSFPFALHEVIELKIEDLTNLGLGVGRKALGDGSKWVVMVPRVLPGESVKVQVNHNYKSYSEATLLEVLVPSLDRVIPLCPYFASCGGCQYQHMNITSQRKWKQSQVSTAIRKIAGLSDIAVEETVGTEHEYHYRSKITPHFEQASAPNSANVVGFQQRNSRNIVDVEGCKVASEAVNLKLTELRKKLLSSVSKSPSGPLLLRESEGGRVVTDPFQEITQTVGDIKFHFKAKEFFQNNPHVSELLVKHVLEQARGDGCDHLVDTYCGSGLFALSAAKHFQSVHGVEISALSVEAAQNNAIFNNIKNVKFLQGDANMIFAKLTKAPAKQTVVVVDPPRRGCDVSFLNQLFAFKPRKMVYISCEPTTQARDAERIVKEGYEITNVTPFDMFPQTRHIENVITFVLKE